MIKSKLTSKAQTTIPLPVRSAPEVSTCCTFFGSVEHGWSENVMLPSAAAHLYTTAGLRGGAGALVWAKTPVLTTLAKAAIRIGEMDMEALLGANDSKSRQRLVSEQPFDREQSQ